MDAAMAATELAEPKPSEAPSGDQGGSSSPSVLLSPLLTCLRAPPSKGTVSVRSEFPSRAATDAICFPSGDQ
jgi:hypothetical protein